MFRFLYPLLYIVTNFMFSNVSLFSIKSAFASKFTASHLLTTLIMQQQYCTKNQIFQVLEYHKKFKNTKKISSFHHPFRLKNTVISISKKLKTRTIPYSKNMVFHAQGNIILHQLFESKEDRISNLRRVQNKIYCVCKKHGIPC